MFVIKHIESSKYFTPFHQFQAVESAKKFRTIKQAETTIKKIQLQGCIVEKVK